MTNNCLHPCDNKTEYGFCKTTVCINPKYNQQTVTAWLSKAGYIQVVRCKDCKERDETGWCDHTCMYTQDTFYCAWGERIEDAETD